MIALFIVSTTSKVQYNELLNFDFNESGFDGRLAPQDGFRLWEIDFSRNENCKTNFQGTPVRSSGQYLKRLT
jgi:hypothetical protein